MTMPTREVLRDQWIPFFEAFASEHLGVGGRQIEHEIVGTEARGLPLQNISAGFKDRENTVVISLGESPGKLLRQSIQSVSHVRVAQTDDGSDSPCRLSP